MNNNQKPIVSFANLVFHPMVVPNVGCIAQGKLSSGYDITVTGGNTGQRADGIENFLVEIVDTTRKSEEGDAKIITKRNMHRDDISLLLEHHHKNRNRKRRSYNKRPVARKYTR